MQYTCEQDIADMQSKYNELALAVGTSVFICLMFTISIRAQYQGGKIQMIEWDVTTVTAGDFTVEFNIEQNYYDEWKKSYSDNSAPALALKVQLKEEIEKNLDDWVRNTEAGKTALEELYGGK